MRNIIALFLFFFSVCTAFTQTLLSKNIVTDSVNFTNSEVWPLIFSATTNRTSVRNSHLNQSNDNYVYARATLHDNIYTLKINPTSTVRVVDHMITSSSGTFFYRFEAQNVSLEQFKVATNGITVSLDAKKGLFSVNKKELPFTSIKDLKSVCFVLKGKVITTLVNDVEVYVKALETVYPDVRFKMKSGSISINKIYKGKRIKLSHENAIEEYVNTQFDQWKLKGKYEKSGEYENRISDVNSVSVKQKFRSEIINQLAEEMIDCASITNTYNADKELFDLNFSGLNHLFVKIPIQVAKELNDDFCSFNFTDKSFDFIDGHFILENVTLVDKRKGKKYYAAKDVNTIDVEQKAVFSDKKDPLDEYFLHKINTSKYFALVIGVDDYQDEEINDLRFPNKDADAIVSTLTGKYTFYTDNIIRLKNPTRYDVINALDSLTKVVGVNDNLLIFYAGHGVWDSDLESGYWLPADAHKNSRANWISNSILRDYIGGIDSRHTLLIADACFSGGIFKTREAFQEQKAIGKIYDLKSRKAITSGAMSSVPDQSVFLKYLLKRLEENDAKTLSTNSLFASFRIAVINNSPNSQVPLYGDIKETGDEGGDFVFLQK